MNKQEAIELLRDVAKLEAKRWLQKVMEGLG